MGLPNPSHETKFSGTNADREIFSFPLFGILGSRCLTGSALLDCHVLKEFGIYMIGILDSLSGVWKPITGTHRVTSTCNISSII